MCNTHARQQSERILQLNWVLTGNSSRPLYSRWSLHAVDETAMTRTPGLSQICNAAVIEKCETSVTRAREETQARSLAICGN
jgi:hypothetical protein